jgi:hypothetical protein
VIRIPPLPRTVTRPISFLVLVAWVAQMAALLSRPAAANLATDLANYGSAAQWRGVYYRGEKIGFTVSQTLPVDNGYELQEDGRLQMSLLGATTAASIRTRARVDRTFALRSFEFALDPGTGPVQVSGTLDRRVLQLTVTTAGGSRTERRELAEPPMLTLNLARRLADAGLRPGARHQWMLFDPATMRNAPVSIAVGAREVVRANDGVVPAFRVEMTFGGLRTTSWVTDTGEVVREESPMGLITIREPPGTARATAVPWRVRADLLEASAVVPLSPRRIDDPRDVRRLRLLVDGADLSAPDGSSSCAIRGRSNPARAIPTQSAFSRPSRSSKATRPKSDRRRRSRCAG